MIITAKQLRKHGACSAQYELFVRLFGDEVIVTKELCIKHAQDFDWFWAATVLLTRGGYEDYLEAVILIHKTFEEVYIKYQEACWTARPGESIPYKTAMSPHREALNIRKAEAFYEATQLISTTTKRYEK